MDKPILVQEQGGNITYNISGFKRIEIVDDAVALQQVNPDVPELFSIRVYFGLDGGGAENIILGRYVDYKDALTYYTELIAKLASGNTFISMLPGGEDREIPDRAERD